MLPELAVVVNEFIVLVAPSRLRVWAKPEPCIVMVPVPLRFSEIVTVFTPVVLKTKVPFISAFPRTVVEPAVVPRLRVVLEFMVRLPFTVSGADAVFVPLVAIVRFP